MNRFVAATLLTVVIYALGVFISLEPNFTLWTRDGRAFYALISLLSFGLTYTCPYWNRS